MVESLYERFSKLSDDELWEISLRRKEKGKTKGNYTKEALIAQKILYLRADCPYNNPLKNTKLGIEDEENRYSNDPEYTRFHR